MFTQETAQGTGSGEPTFQHQWCEEDAILFGAGIQLPLPPQAGWLIPLLAEWGDDCVER